MDGSVVVVMSVFDPGSVVDLVHVESEEVLRPEGGEVVAKRIVDAERNVGFAGLPADERYFVRGYVAGNYTIVRARSVDPGDNTAELMQPSAQPSEQTVGTQEAKPVDPTPATPEGLEVGIPDGAPTGIVEPAPDNEAPEEPALYLNVDEGGDIPNPALWVQSDRQTPEETTSLGTVKESKPLYHWIGDGSVPDPLPSDWELYDGASEPAPAAVEADVPKESDPIPTDASVPASESAASAGATTTGTEASSESKVEEASSVTGAAGASASAASEPPASNQQTATAAGVEPEAPGPASSTVTDTNAADNAEDGTATGVSTAGPAEQTQDIPGDAPPDAPPAVAPAASDTTPVS